MNLSGGISTCTNGLAGLCYAQNGGGGMKDIYGKPQNINWDAVTTYLVSEIKKLNNRITQLENTITEMTNTNTNS
jgi:hypothetical protein